MPRYIRFISVLVLSLCLCTPALGQSLKNRKIGVISLVGDNASLAFIASEQLASGTNQTGLTYYAVPNWQQR